MNNRTDVRMKGHVSWIVPPECQGQRVEFAYGVDDDGEQWERVRDLGDLTTRYRHLGHASDNAGPWEPQNRRPEAASRG